MTKLTNKKDEIVTKTMLNEAVDAILEGVNTMISEFKAENKADHLELKRKIDDLSADTPTLRQHLQLNEKVDRHILHHHLAS